MHKSILQQLQHEIRERKWSIPDLLDESGLDLHRTVLWRKLREFDEVPRRHSRQQRHVPLTEPEIEALTNALRTRNPSFAVAYPNRKPRRIAA